MNGEKTEPIKRYIKALGSEYVGIVGIGTDEPVRLKRMHERHQISLLEKYGYTTQMAQDLCIEYGLLSPIYDSGRKRQGCWFCPNGAIAEYASIKKQYPLLWQELQMLSEVPNTCNRSFKYGKTFAEIDQMVDAVLAEPKQISIFD